MSTQAIPSTTEQAEPKQRKERTKERKSYTINLDGENDARLRLTLKFKSDGTATSHVVHSTKPHGPKGKRENERGATVKHTTAEAGVTTLENLVAKATKLGWKRRERKSGFIAAPDAFDMDSLPSAKAKASKK